jgi:hypothetical protein
VKQAAIARLTSTCFTSGGVQAVQPGASIMVRSGLSEPWQARAAELLANCQPSILAFELFQNIVGTSQPVFQTLDMDGRSDELENHGSETWQLVKAVDGWRIAAISYSSQPGQ